MSGLFGGGSRGPSMKDNFQQYMQQIQQQQQQQQQMQAAADARAQQDAQFRKEMAALSANSEAERQRMLEESKKMGGGFAGAPMLTRGTFLSTDSATRGLVL